MIIITIIILNNNDQKTVTIITIKFLFVTVIYTLFNFLSIPMDDIPIPDTVFPVATSSPLPLGG